MTANLLGSQGGLTSYVIAPGVASADLDSPGFDGPGKHLICNAPVSSIPTLKLLLATLVVGASTAAATYVDETLGMAIYDNCNIADGQAVCEDVVIMMGPEGRTMTDTFTESVVPFTVQGGGSASIQTSPAATDFATWTGTPAIYESTYTTFPGETLPTATGAASSTGSGSKTSSASGSTTATPTGKDSGALNVHSSSLLTFGAAGLIAICAVLV